MAFHNRPIVLYLSMGETLMLSCSQCGKRFCCHVVNGGKRLCCHVFSGGNAYVVMYSMGGNYAVVMYSMGGNYTVVILHFMQRWEKIFLLTNRCECWELSYFFYIRFFDICFVNFLVGTFFTQTIYKRRYTIRLVGIVGTYISIHLQCSFKYS